MNMCELNKILRNYKVARFYNAIPYFIYQTIQTIVFMYFA